jgi:hypothetical protein
MIKQFYLCVFLFVITFEIHSQTYYYCIGDSLYLGLDSYNGSLQWQQSSDSINWSNISGANYSPYGLIFWGNKFYRALITNIGCNAIYSPVNNAVENNVGCPPPSYPSGSVFCNNATVVVAVVNPVTGRTWMDRNLGAIQVATSSTDVNSFGDLYQWGRRSDGHQCRNSATTTILSSLDQPSHGNFILAPNNLKDWRSPQNTNLWQGVTGLNNPCPTSYRIPTEVEWNQERLTWSSNNIVGAFASVLKLTMGGRRFGGNGSLEVVNVYGGYWSSTVNGTNSQYQNVQGAGAFTSTDVRSVGNSIRCIKE